MIISTCLYVPYRETVYINNAIKITSHICKCYGSIKINTCVMTELIACKVITKSKEQLFKIQQFSVRRVLNLFGASSTACRSTCHINYLWEPFWLPKSFQECCLRICRNSAGNTSSQQLFKACLCLSDITEFNRNKFAIQSKIKFEALCEKDNSRCNLKVYLSAQVLSSLQVLPTSLLNTSNPNSNSSSSAGQILVVQ